MPKNTLLLVFLLFCSFLYSQKPALDFEQLLAQQPDREAAFCLENTGSTLIGDLVQAGIRIKYITPEQVYIQASPAQLKAFSEHHFVRPYYHFSHPQLMNDTSRALHYVNEVNAGTGLPQGYTGKNVIIGYVDTGIDFNHPDFIDENGKTRVLRYWDHSMNGPNPPQPYNYGQVWDSSEINAGLCTSLDQQNHGTTVAGSGSGNARANGTNMGMAPNSNIIIVESDFSLANWDLTIADACDYIFKVADSLDMPAIVNLSLGSYIGSHDGNDPASEYMESLLDEKPGRLIVCAAGNSGAQGKYHLHGEASADTSFVWFLNNPNNQIAANSIYFDLWTEVSEIGNLSFAYGADLPTSYEQRGRTAFYNALATVNNTIYDTIYSPDNNRIATVEYYTSISGGAYHLETLVTNIDSTAYLFRFMTAGSGEYDLWSGAFQGLNSMVTNVPSAAQMPAIIHYQQPDTLQTIVSYWACSEKVITVANSHNRISHIDRNYNVYVNPDTTPTGKLSPNSSKGPSRLNVQKPDITASGDITLSAGPLALLQNSAANASIDSGGWHVRNGGTSMASPVVAGIAALYFERCRYANYLDFKEDVIATAFSDMYTGTLPNFGYGHGKIHALDLLVAQQNEPDPTITSVGTQLISSSAPNYQWTLDGADIPGATGQSLEIGPPYGEIGVYTVSEDGCVSSSETTGVFLGLETLSEAGILLSPNPTSGAFRLESETQIVSVALIDMRGKHIPLSPSGNGNYDISKLPAGSYLIEIQTEKAVSVAKVVRM